MDKTFSEMTNTWFDALTALCKANGSIKCELLRHVTVIPSKLAVTHLQWKVEHIVTMSETSAIRAVNLTALVPLRRHCQRVLDKGFKNEFRFSFDGPPYPRTGGRCSAASELFSMIGQALNY